MHQVLQPVADLAFLALDLGGEGAVGPVGLQRLRRGDEGQVVAAEGAAVGARFPDVQLGLHQHQRHRQAEAGQRLRQGDDVGADARGLEAEERAGTTAADLDVVHDEQHVVALAQLFQFLQPAQRGDVDAAFALHRFHDDGGRLVHAAAGVLEHALQVGHGVHVRTEVSVVGHERGVAQRVAGGFAELHVGGDRQRAAAHAVKAVRERDDVGAALDLARDLQRGLDRVGAGGTGELQGVAPVARLEQHAIHRLQETLLRAGGHVEAVDDAVRLHILQQLFLENRIVVAVVQGAGATEEVDVLGAFLIDQRRTPGLIEDHGERPDVAPHLRLHPVKDFQVHMINPPFIS